MTDATRDYLITLLERVTDDILNSFKAEDIEVIKSTVKLQSSLMNYLISQGKDI